MIENHIVYANCDENLPILATATEVTSQEGIDDLFRIVTNPARSLPVIVLTEPHFGVDPKPTHKYVINPNHLAKAVAGAAHVYCLPWSIAHEWTRTVGKIWSVFGGAARIYLPGLEVGKDDDPREHPLTMYDRIIWWRDSETFQGVTAFESHLIQRSLESTRNLNLRDVAPLLNDVRTSEANEKLSATTDARESIAIYEEEIESLYQKIDSLKGEIDYYATSADKATAEADQLRRDNYVLRERLDIMRNVLQDGTASADLPLPESYDDMAGWVEFELAGRLVLHPRAIRALKTAIYEDISKVGEALRLLAGHYRDMRLGKEGAKDTWEKAVAAIGMDHSGAITQTRAGEQGEEYYIPYPTSGSPKVFLRDHLRCGSNKDQRFTLRIYFFWDDETRQVVVGYLPGHLTTRQT